ncbi:hypothetical protein CEV34_4246 [Brucella pseudogrignonensis]|uniref:Uncharacterized protein n=1 Tax=Brucella pseudogrignonensis TaxID=419475 RepID=A0A256G5Q0_9HYPH|nr:hypothetical protein CEV34_4246 [Brucella pseudogrignonensis]
MGEILTITIRRHGLTSGKTRDEREGCPALPSATERNRVWDASRDGCDRDGSVRRDCRAVQPAGQIAERWLISLSGQPAIA